MANKDTTPYITSFHTLLGYNNHGNFKTTADIDILYLDINAHLRGPPLTLQSACPWYSNNFGFFCSLEIIKLVFIIVSITHWRHIWQKLYPVIFANKIIDLSSSLICVSFSLRISHSMLSPMLIFCSFLWSQHYQNCYHIIAIEFQYLLKMLMTLSFCDNVGRF